MNKTESTYKDGAPSLDELKRVSREISDPSAFISGSKIVLEHLRDGLSLLHDKNQPPFSTLRSKGGFKAPRQKQIPATTLGRNSPNLDKYDRSGGAQSL